MDLTGIDAQPDWISGGIELFGKGKVVLLNVWATWCGPCVQALPDYLQMASQFDPQKVLFVAVNLEEQPQTIRDFLESRDLNPITVMDRTGTIAANYQVAGIPHTVIVGPGGLVQQVRVGYSPNNASVIGTAVRQILDGTWQRPDPTSTPVKPNMPQITE